MADVELLPLPRWMETYRIPGDDFHTGPDQYLSDRMQAYTRANLAPLQAENERLRAEVREAREFRDKMANAIGNDQLRRFIEKHGEPVPLTIRMQQAEARAERLAEVCERLARKWELQADEHGVRQFTGNDHRLFANELRAALAQEDRND